VRRELSLGSFVCAALVCTLIIQLAGCSSVQDTPTTPVDYSAYGKKWRYFAVEHYIREWGFGSTHGFFGLKERTTQDVYLVTESGEKIDVPARIVALQKDGSYKAVWCCQSMRTRAKVYNFEGKLVLMFEQTRDRTTDCRVYPAGKPDDEVVPEGQRVRYSILFGEFDVQAGLFRMREFFPGVPESESRKKLGVNPTFEQIDEFFYSRRKAFDCGPIAE